MGCEGVDVDPVVKRRSGDRRCKSCAPVTATYPELPNNFSVGDTHSVDIERRASTFALAGRLKVGRPVCC